jgi:geranylgeranyl pyrophosphate synthase
MVIVLQIDHHLRRRRAVDFYAHVEDYLLALPAIGSWPEMDSILTRATATKPRDWQLPLVGCEAVAGIREPAFPAAAAVACLQISIILIDDMLDDDPVGEYHHLGMPETANLAAAFQAAAFEALMRGQAQPGVKLAALQSLNHMVLTTALGQHLDVQNPDNEEDYWELVRTKSAPFFSESLYAGAVLGGARPETAAQIQQLGHLYGEMIQIHDDLNDAMAVPANPDWLQGRAPLPILFAQVVNHPERELFLALRQAIPDPDALHEAQNILIRCGAVSYAITQIMQRYQAAQRLLATMQLVFDQGFETLLEEMIDPVHKLLATIDHTADAFLKSL